MGSQSDIKRTINRIIETDKRARDALAQVREDSANADATIELRVKEVRDEYMSRAMQRVEVIRRAESQYAEDEWKKVEKRYSDASDRLDRQFEANGDRWADELVRAVIGGE